MPYEDTTFNVERLRRYARRVARELAGVPSKTEWVEEKTEVPVTRWKWGIFPTKTTEISVSRRLVETPGSRWLLGLENSSNRSRWGGGDYGDDHYDVSYYLEHDGSLTTEVRQWYDGIQDNRYFAGSDETSAHPMTTVEMLVFDRQNNKSQGRIWAREKGVGAVRSTHRTAPRESLTSTCICHREFPNLQDVGLELKC